MRLITEVDATEVLIPDDGGITLVGAFTSLVGFGSRPIAVGNGASAALGAGGPKK